MIKSTIVSNKYLLFAFRLALGFIFVFAGLEKISNPEKFAVAIENYKIMPVIFINFIAIILPFLELITGLLLIFGISVKENIFIINLLLTLFILLVAIAISRGLDIECGCFGTNDGQKAGLQKIIENLFMLLLGLLIFFFDKNPFKIGKSL
ncbi:MAG: DoxX family membrane protein [Bacteroidetes bacterium]|nr:DoxX family membrane protein [Bacteroidota bacterium]